jgi:hypothetical protein
MKTIRAKVTLDCGYLDYYAETDLYLDDGASDQEIDEEVRRWVDGKVDYEWQSLG